jgi:hypothetical protein
VRGDASRPGASGDAVRKPRPAPDWFERESRPRATIAKLGRRLLQRGGASWRIWVLVVLAGSGVWALLKARGSGLFEVTVVLRVSEGRVSRQGAMLGRNKLRAYVNDLALTNARLIALMSKHPKAFPRVATDPVFAVQTFRENMTIDIAENDFIEERGSDDPPRSARLMISYVGGDPELTWQIAQELLAAVIGSTMAGQRSALEADLATATAEATSAAAAVTDLEAQNRGGPNAQLVEMRRRLLSAQQRVEEASIALRALGQEQMLRFEVADRGRVPPRPNPVRVGVKTFIVTSALGLLAAWLLAGAFDPRVLDETDVVDLGMPVMGRLPRIAPQPGRGDDGKEPPKRLSITSGVPDPRV